MIYTETMKEVSILLDMRKILHSLLGKDLDAMSDKEFSDKVEEIRASNQIEKPLSLDELMQIPMEQWGYYDVGVVRFVPAAGVKPCELCARVSGKCLDRVNAKFYLDHVSKNHRPPVCLVIVPAYRILGGCRCNLPEAPKEETKEMPGYQVFHQWAEDVFDRDCAPVGEE